MTEKKNANNKSNLKSLPGVKSQGGKRSDTLGIEQKQQQKAKPRQILNRKNIWKPSNDR